MNVFCDVCSEPFDVAQGCDEFICMHCGWTNSVGDDDGYPVGVAMHCQHGVEQFGACRRCSDYVERER